LPQYPSRFRLLPLVGLLSVGACLSTEGYYRYQDAGASGSAGVTGTAGNGSAGIAGDGGTAGGSGTSGNGGGGSAGSIATGRGGTTGNAGTTGTAGTTGAAGRGGTTGAAGRGGTTGSAGTTGSGGAGTVLFMDDFEAGLSTKWDFGSATPPMLTMDGTKVLPLMETAGDQKLAAAGMSNWTNYSIEAKVKVLSFTGTSSSDGVAICARLTSVDSFYYLLLSGSSDTKALKIKINNGGNSSLSSSLDSSGFAVNTWVTLRLDVQGNTLTAYLNGTMKGTYTATGTDVLAAGGMALMVQRANVEFDDVVVRALP
jgi:hypothetical protein